MFREKGRVAKISQKLKSRSTVLQSIFSALKRDQARHGIAVFETGCLRCRRFQVPLSTFVVDCKSWDQPLTKAARVGGDEMDTEDLPPLIETPSRSSGTTDEPKPSLSNEEVQRLEVLETYQTQEPKFMVYNPNSQYVKYRRVVVDWMCEVGEEFQFATTTTHIAIKYLDRLLGTLEVAKARIQLVAMACIFVAAKYDEPDDMLPTLAELNECAENAYTIDLIRDMESMVLKYLDWNLGVVVPLHFLSLWIDAGAVFPDDRVSGQPVSKRCVKYLLKYIDFFADLGQQEYTFQQYLPSRLAAATIAAGRTALRFEPIWNCQLSLLTGISADEVFPCYTHLWRAYEKNFPSGQSLSRRVSTIEDFVASYSAPTSPFSPPLNSPVPGTPSTPLTPCTPQTPLSYMASATPKLEANRISPSGNKENYEALPFSPVNPKPFSFPPAPAAASRVAGSRQSAESAPGMRSKGYALRSLSSKAPGRYHPYSEATKKGSALGGNVSLSRAASSSRAV
eukprot:g65963.t1